MKKVIVLLLWASLSVWAGFQPVDFFFYRVAYKNLAGLTRHKDYHVPIWDEPSANYWLGGLGFLNDVPYHGAAASWNNGKEWLGITNIYDQVRGLWMDRNDGKYDCRNAFSRHNRNHPYLQFIRSIYADEEGAVYLQCGGGWRLVSGKLDMNTGSLASWKGDTTSKSFAGITGIMDGTLRKFVAVGMDGTVSLYSQDLTDLQTFAAFEDSIFHPEIVKSDGKLDISGVATIWIFGNGRVDPEKDSSKYVPSLLRIDFNPVTLEHSRHLFPLQIPPAATVDDGVSPISSWDDFIPFWVGGEQLRIVALSEDHLHVFSERGIWIESPWGTKRLPNGNPYYRVIPQMGDLYRAKALMSTNHRKNWQSHQDILVAEDFRFPGHGLRRLGYTPDGFDDHIQLDVRMRESAGSGEMMNKPVLQIENLSSYRQLMDFKVRLWLSREELYPDTILAERYWTEDDMATVETGCSAENPNVCWADILFSEDFVLDPGQVSRIDGIQLGIHPRDWKAWSRSNDPSWQNVRSGLATNENLTVYIKGALPGQWKKVWGKEPSPLSIPLPLGWQPGPPPVDASEEMILGFENMDGWGSEHRSVLVQNGTDKKQGLRCLQVNGGGWNQIESRPFPHQGKIGKVTLAIRQPNPGVNLWWSGQVQVFVESRRLGLYSQWVGQVDLTTLPKGEWTDISLDMPEWLQSRLDVGASDLVLKIAVNTPIGSQPYLLDDLRLEQ